MADAPAIIVNLPGFPFSNFPSLGTIAALRAVSIFGLTPGDNYVVDGGAMAGDGGGGVFSWNATSTATDDGVSVIIPSSLTSGQAGRWILTGSSGSRAFNGAIGVKVNSGASVIYTDGPSSTARAYLVRTNTLPRWQWGGDSIPEAGSNAGTNFQLLRYGDSGSFLEVAWNVNRSTGNSQWAQQFHVGTVGALDALIPFVEPNAQILGASRTGTYGIVGFSDSRDLPLSGAMSNIGAAGFCYNANSAQVQFGYAGYFEARRAAGAGSTEGVEVNILNGGSTVDVTPSDPFASGGAVSIGLLLSCGRNDVPGFNNPASAAILISSNGAKYRRGIVVDALAADPAGPIEAVTMATEYRLAWYLGNVRKAFIAGVDRAGMGTLNLGILPVFSGNAAAVAAGLLAGDAYRTSTGQMMVAF